MTSSLSPNTKGKAPAHSNTYQHSNNTGASTSTAIKPKYDGDIELKIDKMGATHG